MENKFSSQYATSLESLSNCIPIPIGPPVKTDSHRHSNSTTIDDFDFLDFAPMTAQDLLFFGSPSPDDMELAGDEWTLSAPYQLVPAPIDRNVMIESNSSDRHLENCFDDEPVSAASNLPACISPNQTARNWLTEAKNWSKETHRTTKAPSEGQTVKVVPTSNELMTAVERMCSQPRVRTPCSNFKRFKSMNAVKMIDTPRCIDPSMDDDDVRNELRPHDGRRRYVSKNLTSERKRRTKLKQLLYALREVVPEISKAGKKAAAEGRSACVAHGIIRPHSPQSQIPEYNVLQVHEVEVKGPGDLKQILAQKLQAYGLQYTANGTTRPH